MRRVLPMLIWGCVAATVVGFFLPWAHINTQAPGVVSQLRETAESTGLLGGLTDKLGEVTATVKKGASTVTGTIPGMSDIPRQVSGVQIPQIANQENAQIALALFEMVTGESQHIGLKSYAVYLLPGIALLCAALLTLLGRVTAVPFVVAALCAAISGIGFWKLLTTNTSALFIAITIGSGLWVSLSAYAVLALTSLVGAVARPRA